MPRFEQVSLSEVRYTAKRGRRRGETSGNGKGNAAGDQQFADSGRLERAIPANLTALGYGADRGE